MPALMPAVRYAILRHDAAAGTHFDLMFETVEGSMLATWRAPAWPLFEPTELFRLRDHRRLYLDHEGDLGLGRGWVQRIAEGTCEVTSHQDGDFTFKLLTGSIPMTLQFQRRDGELYELQITG